METKSVALQMENLLDEYVKDVRETTDEVMKDTATEAVQKLKATSPKAKTGRRKGRYAKGWKVKKNGKMDYVVYNSTDYQLTHLLENGHVVKNQYGEYDRWDPEAKHIEPVEQWANEVVPIKISRGLS